MKRKFLRWRRDEVAALLASGALDEMFRAHRYALLVPHGEGRGTTAERLNRKRFARRSMRALQKQLRIEPAVHERLAGLPLQVLAARFRSNQLADALCAGRKDRWLPIHRRSRKSQTVEVRNFSFIDDPVATLACFKQLIDHEASSLDVSVNFHDEHVVDIAPYLLLAELWNGSAPVFTGGNISFPVQKVIEAVRLRRLLRMAPFRGVDEARGVWAFPVHRKSATDRIAPAERIIGPQRREKTTDDFCDWIDQCLGVSELQQQLTGDGRYWLACIVGEILDNAERHSSPGLGDGMWSAAGFMSRRLVAGQRMLVLCMAFLSFGRTISSSLETCSHDIAVRLDQYCHLHRRCGRSRDTLRTVVALQDYVTRVREASAEDRGGIGFQEVIEFANEIGSNENEGRQPRLTLISGSSCIQLQSPYIRGARAPVAGSPREIWFNEENAATNAPATTHAYDLPQSFPGTLISLRLSLDPQSLKAKSSK